MDDKLFMTKRTSDYSVVLGQQYRHRFNRKMAPVMVVAFPAPEVVQYRTIFGRELTISHRGFKATFRPVESR